MFTLNCTVLAGVFFLNNNNKRKNNKVEFFYVLFFFFSSVKSPLLFGKIQHAGVSKHTAKNSDV